MFGIGLSEIVVITLVMLIFIKPDDLPAALRAFGRWYGKIKKTITELTEFKNEFMKQVEKAASLEEQQNKEKPAPPLDSVDNAKPASDEARPAVAEARPTASEAKSAAAEAPLKK